MLYRFNKWIEKWMMLVTPICLLVGVLFPEIASRGLPFVPFLFAFMTFIGSLKSSFRDMGNVLRRPLPMLLSLLTLHLIVPALACLLGLLVFPDNQDFRSGMVLEFVVPSAVTGLMWIGIYDGNSPLSLSLVILDTVLAPFTIPAALHLFLGSNVQIDAAQMMHDLIFMIAIPAVAAMVLNQLSHGKIKESWPSKLAPFSKICLILVVTSNSSKVAPYIRHLNGQMVLAAFCVLCLAASGYALGWLLAALSHQDHASTISLVFGSGMRNINAGAVIASSYFPAQVMFPVMIGTLFQQMLATIFGWLVGRKHPDSTPTSSCR